MRKISNIMETSIAGLVSILEFREHSSTQKDSDHPVKPKLDKNENFSSFVLRERKNKLLLLIGISAAIIQLIILKVLFPFPDFISDSYNYIETAALHLNVNLWPVGYAKFLWLVHQINYSDTFLVCIQYLLLLSALLYFYYSIVYLYKPSPTNSSLLFIFLIFNPIFPYLSNCVLSDALFTAITILWITQLIWQINRPPSSSYPYFFRTHWSCIHDPIYRNLLSDYNGNSNISQPCQFTHENWRIATPTCIYDPICSDYKRKNKRYYRDG